MIFISGPISNTTDYEERFKKAKEYLIKQGYENIINPIDISRMLPNYPNLPYKLYLEVCLSTLKHCDEIYVLKGWENSIGSSEELKCALENDLHVILED